MDRARPYCIKIIPSYHVSVLKDMGMAGARPHPLYDIAPRAPLLKLLEITPDPQSCILCCSHPVASNLPPPPVIQRWCSRNAQICNKIDNLEGSFEIASATNLFYLVKDVSSYPEMRLPNI